MTIHSRAVDARSILTKAAGFAGTGAYTHTLNPYAGCAFACRYCYMRTFPGQRYREEPWGTWVDVKANAADVYRREARALKRRDRPLRIFMSSGTDPYQPLERTARVTRGLLEAMLEDPPERITVQTRSPFVLEDIDLLAALRLRARVRVSMTVETDRDDIRRLFAPTAPSMPQRLGALERLHAAGIETQAAVSPLLPCTKGFPALLAGKVDRVVLDTLRIGDGAGGRRSAALGMPALFRRHRLMAWYAPDLHVRAARWFARTLPPGTVHTMAGDF